MPFITWCPFAILFFLSYRSGGLLPHLFWLTYVVEVGATQALYFAIGSGQIFAAGTTTLVRAKSCATCPWMQPIVAVLTAL